MARIRFIRWFNCVELKTYRSVRLPVEGQLVDALLTEFASRPNDGKGRGTDCRGGPLIGQNGHTVDER